MEGDPSELFCSIRKMWVKANPEEKVRQKLISFLIERLYFPSSSILVEKSLHQMPHLALNPKADFPDRRADLVCFAKGIHPDFDLYPLLLIECKAVPINQNVIQQTLGYNHHLRAHFIAVANERETRTGWYDHERGEYRFVDYIPTYDQLIRSLVASSGEHGDC
jgi:hypothetical protein